ncbi:hypothetical protein ACIPJ2_16090 [Curtobacterium sp. NPDC090217]|uniref:hypothetical protein n=1 Tax=Curtobacterium sp. NPDC090217 TaxID=3363970 RepID=UPI00382141DF
MKSTTGTTYAPCTIDRTARIGLSPFELRGIRLIDGDDGAKPGDAADQGTDTDVDEADKGTSQEDADNDADSDDKGEKFDSDKALGKIRKLNSENKNLRDRATKAEQAAEANKDSGEKVTALEAENLKLRVAVKHGLPESLMKRLSGTTEEELLQDAEELLEMFGKDGGRPPSGQPREQLRPGSGNSNDAGDPTADLDKFAEDVFRR